MEEHIHEHSHTYTHAHDHVHADGDEHVHEHTHTYTHTHDHAHDPAHPEEHTHTHDHEHDHDHAHDHAHTHEGGADETKALLTYMLHHNEHHADELVNLANQLPEKARKKLMEAVGTFEAANVQLQEVLDLLG